MHASLWLHAKRDLFKHYYLHLHIHRDWGLAEGESIHVMGSLQSLGSWKQQQAPRMTRLASPHWQLEVSIFRSVDMTAHPHPASHFPSTCRPSSGSAFLSCRCWWTSQSFLSAISTWWCHVMGSTAQSRALSGRSPFQKVPQTLVHVIFFFIRQPEDAVTRTGVMSSYRQ